MRVSKALSILALVRLTWDSIEIGMMSVERGYSEGAMTVRMTAENLTKCLLEEIVKELHQISNWTYRLVEAARFSSSGRLLAISAVRTTTPRCIRLLRRLRRERQECGSNAGILLYRMYALIVLRSVVAPGL